MESVVKKSSKSNLRNKSRLETNSTLVHKEKQTFRCDICGKSFITKTNLANKLLQFMKETNHLNVTIVITALLKRVTLMHMFHPFMKEKSLSNVPYVMKDFIRTLH